MIDEIQMLVPAGCILLTIIVIYYNYRRTKKTMDTIEQMLDAAADGSFSEKKFDESRLSALETKFAHYFSASEVSARNVALEKDKIKTLIADISHQTKTPIANLLLYSELLEETPLPEPAKSNVEALHAQTEKLQFLIDALVKLSRLENGILQLSPGKQPLWPVLESAAAQFAAKAEKKGLALILERSDVTACFDAKWTQEVFCNLIDNAIKYTAHGGVTVSVLEYELFVRIDIADTGTGILEEEQAKVFSRFYRAEQTKDCEGVGIGLYLAREIVCGEGGYMKVSSVYGHGTTFSVFLPHA